METCEYCEQSIASDSPTVRRVDGFYHEACYEEWSAAEEDYWLSRYEEHRAVDAYDWGNYKNPEYLAHLLDNA